TPATVGANKGDGINYMQFGRFDQPGTAYDGPYGSNDGVSWLDNKYLSFTTDQTSANVPPVISSQSVCDSMVVCVGQLATFDVTFLSPEPSQITTPTSSAPTVSNWTIVTATSGLAADISVHFTPLPQDIGYHIVTFSGTDDGSPVLTSSLTIVIHVLQGAVLDPGSLAVCDNGAEVDLITVLGGTPQPGGDWTDPEGMAHDGTFDPLTDPVGDYIYVLAAGTSCASTGTATISTVPHAFAGDDAAVAYCSNGVPTDLFPVLLGGPQPGGSWIDPSDLAFTGILDPAADAPGAYQYIVYGTAPCPNDTGTVVVTIPLAVDPGLPTATTLCADAPPLDMVDALDGTPSPGGTWTGPDGNPFPGTFVAQTDLVGVYTYLVTTQLPCTDQSATLTIAVDPVPWAGTDAAIVRCANDEAVDLFPLLGGAPDNDGSWFDPILAPHSGSLYPPTALSGAHAYVVLGSGACTHLIDSSFVAVTINPLPRVAFLAEPDSGCNPLPVTLINTTPLADVGSPCVWHFGDGTSEVGCSSVAHTYAEPGSYPVQLTITSPDGCTDFLFRPDAVLVEPAPQATFFFSPNPGTEGNTTVVFDAEDPHAVHFEWTVDGVHFGQDRNVQRWFNDVLGAEYNVCLSVLDRYHCADTICQIVPVVIPSIFIPNAFTPDGDGLNDKFFPNVLDVVREEHLLQVFDRWGELIFSSTDPGEGWDGHFKDGGEMLPQGVYVWRLTTLSTATADKLEMIGSVTLLR
ncbi:MAG TPA: gliding motility-associated C-terminal domain-containing protein, partial [Flavobacteriales bacterium]|nr:gliding motility-associated C-terminal domain-containing protein [Flavobacteriales bacterium]